MRVTVTFRLSLYRCSKAQTLYGALVTALLGAQFPPKRSGRRGQLVAPKELTRGGIM